MNSRKFELMPQSWYKRREPTAKPDTIEVVEVNGFNKIDNSYCNITVVVNGELHHLNARVNINDISGRWTVHGMNPHGLTVLLRLKE